MDTGYKINWDNDFKIETTVNIPTAGNRYLIIGSYADSVATNLSIEVDTSNALRVYMATGQVDKTFGTVTVGENINVVYIWTASTNTYTITATGTTTNISLDLLRN